MHGTKSPITRQELLLRIVDWKGYVTRAEKTVGWNVKPSTSHLALPFCSGVSLSIGKEVISELKFIVKEPSFLHGAQSTDFLIPQLCTVDL